MIIVEDLHWIDGASEAMLENYVDAVAGTRVLLVVTFRPEYPATWMRKSYCQRLALAALDPQASAELLRALIGERTELGPLAERIRERTRGNPFFIEEIVQHLAERGHLTGTRGAYVLAGPIDAEALPTTVQSVLAARIDRLADAEKRVLQTAAVIGKEFTERLLRRVSPIPEADVAAALATLMQAELLYEIPSQQEAAYVFKHPLTQEVAYSSQLSSVRAKTHAAVADAIADLDAERIQERAAVVAYHWDSAGAALNAAWWYRIAAALVGTSDLREAARQWQRLREITAPLDDPQATFLGVIACYRLLNARWSDLSPDEVAALTAEAKQRADRVGGTSALSLALAGQALSKIFAGDVVAGAVEAREVVRIWEAAGNVDGLLGALVLVVTGEWALGHFPAALKVIERGLALEGADRGRGKQDIGISPYISLVVFRGMILAEIGQLAEAVRDLEHGKRLALEGGETELVTRAHRWHAVCAYRAGDARTAMEEARCALQLAEASNNQMSRAQALDSIALAHRLAGDVQAAVAVSDEALAIIRERRIILHQEGLFLAHAAEAHLERGNIDRSDALVEEAIAVSCARRTKAYELLAQLISARVLLARDGKRAHAEVERTLRRAQALIVETDARAYEPVLHIESARLAAACGDQRARASELRAAQRLFTRMGAPLRAEVVARELTDLRTQSRPLRAHQRKSRGRQDHQEKRRC
jgi:adenylate cyclase